MLGIGVDECESAVVVVGPFMSAIAPTSFLAPFVMLTVNRLMRCPTRIAGRSASYTHRESHRQHAQRRDHQSIDIDALENSCGVSG